MAEQPRRAGGSSTALAFVIGGLLILVAIIGWVLLTGQGPTVAPPDSVDVDVELPSAPSPPPMPDPQPLPAPVPSKPG